MDAAPDAFPQRRGMVRLPEAALVAAAVAICGNGVLLAFAWPRGDILWALGQVLILGVAVVVRRRRPDLPVSGWFALFTFPLAISELSDTGLAALLEGGGSDGAIATVAAVSQLAGAFAGVLTIMLLCSYPGGERAVGWERRLVQVAWAALAVPVVVVLAASRVPIPYYVADDVAIENPFRVLPFGWTSDTVDAVLGLAPLLLLGGVSVLVAHYLRAQPLVRRQMRWLLVPLPLVVFGMVLNLLLRDSGQVVVWVVWLILQPAIPIAAAVGILQPVGWDPDRVLRRSLVFGALWTAIVGALVATAALAGTAAGEYVPIEWAVLIAIAVSLVFQPLRRRLETMAARLVFGRRVEHAEVITSLGETLAKTFDLQSLLPRMVGALEEGLRLEWARVELGDARDARTAAAEPAAHVVPIELDGEVLGSVACGPKRAGQWTDADRAVVATFARQAALAVRNVRLTEQTAQYAADIEVSRLRIARAAESERRRIERNIHDGIQQDLVVLIGMAGRIQDESVHAVMAAGMADLRRRLERVLGDLRDLASGIYPSVLSDQGIVPAVEALVATHPHPIRLRAQSELRSLRLPEEIEGAAYFTVAEAITNSLKHARASAVEVTLSRQNGSLIVEIVDDGVGFDPELRAPGRGLEGLADRVGAIGGTFAVESACGRGTVVQARLRTGNGASV